MIKISKIKKERINDILKMTTVDNYGNDIPVLYDKETNTYQIGTNVEIDGNLVVNGSGGHIYQHFIKMYESSNNNVLKLVIFSVHEMPYNVVTLGKYLQEFACTSVNNYYIANGVNATNHIIYIGCYVERNAIIKCVGVDNSFSLVSNIARPTIFTDIITEL